jgi:hypothetical protein
LLFRLVPALSRDESELLRDTPEEFFLETELLRLVQKLLRDVPALQRDELELLRHKEESFLPPTK